MDKILVMWSEGKYKGTTSLVKKTAVKQGTIAAFKHALLKIWGEAHTKFGVISLPPGAHHIQCDDHTIY